MCFISLCAIEKDLLVKIHVKKAQTAMRGHAQNMGSPQYWYHIFAPGVLEEAEFYNIASLVRLVKERIRDNENRTSQVQKQMEDSGTIEKSRLCSRTNRRPK